MSIVQAATAYNNPETGEITIIILNKAIWMGKTMDHTLLNPNQLSAYEMTVQDNPVVEAQIFIATEDYDFMIPLFSKGTILGFSKINPRRKRATNLPTCYLFVGA